MFRSQCLFVIFIDKYICCNLKIFPRLPFLCYPFFVRKIGDVQVFGRHDACLCEDYLVSMICFSKLPVECTVCMINKNLLVLKVWNFINNKLTFSVQPECLLDSCPILLAHRYPDRLDICLHSRHRGVLTREYP